MRSIEKEVQDFIDSDNTQISQIEIVNEDQAKLTLVKEKSFGDYLIFVDESGDDGLNKIDNKYPYYSITFCILNKEIYSDYCKSIKKLKMKFFNSDVIVLHETDLIKKLRAGDQYSYNNTRTQQLLKLISKEDFNNFIQQLNELISNTTFTIFSIVIDKKSVQKHLKRDTKIKGLLHKVAVTRGIECIEEYLYEQNQADKLTSIIFEESENNKSIKNIFADIIVSRIGAINLQYEICHKQSNLDGLQLADLTAQAAVKYIMNKSTTDRSVITSIQKIPKSKDGQIIGKGIIVVDKI